MPASRQPTHRYRDPLDEIWVAAAQRIGFTVTRTRDAYAATDGAGAIHIGEADLLDADDCLAQIVFHELCHALVEGEAAWRRADWGLDNMTARDEPREHACLRVQAALAARHGLREVLAATTEHRPFYDAIVDGAAEDDPAARAALSRAARPPFAPHLDEALASSARVVREAARWAPPESLAARVAPRHPVGFAAGARPGESCGSCVWRARGARGDRCLQAATRVDRAWPACARWEGALDCRRCGACCREAFHSVSFGRRDPFARRHPELTVVREGTVEVRRDGERCAALAEDAAGRFACGVYADRPRPCRDFPIAGASCLLARRRVGLAAPA